MNTTASASTGSGTRSPAPGALALVQDFINTRYIEGGTDEIATPAHLAAWLSARALLEDTPRLTDIDLGRALALRETLRQLLAAHHDGAVDEEALARFNALAASAGLMMRLEADGAASLKPLCTGMDGAVARLIAIVYDAIAAGTWQRLKACRRDACRWAFYDASKNRSGAWCSMASCGNREKVHAYQQRRRGAAPATGAP